MRVWHFTKEQLQISADRTEDLASSGLSVSVGTEWLFRTNGPILA